MLYQAWSEGWGPAFYWVGVTRRITHRARLEWQREREAGRGCRRKGSGNMTRRTSNPRQRPTSRSASRTTGTGTPGRPLTKLRTIEETAELLNVSPRTVRRLIDSGALQVHRFGRLVRIADQDIAVLLAANRSF